MSISENRLCQKCKTEFAIEPEDFEFYKNFGLPAPEICPVCRWKHLLAFWVFGRFRKTKSALSGKTIITVFPESVKFPLYERTEFVSDVWDPLSYGKNYNPSRSFIEQFAELQAAVPHPHQGGINNVNCDWTDDVWNSRNCYLCRSLLDSEFLSYGYRTYGCKNSIDLTYCFDTELSYDCLNCFKCYKVRYSFDSHDCLESSFLFDCRNCSNCFMCWNLRNKQYCIFNKPYSKEQYFEELKKFEVNSWSGIQNLKKEFARIIKEEAVHRADFNFQSVNSSGNFITESKNCFDCYFTDESENVRHSFRIFKGKEIIDSVGCLAEKVAISVEATRSYDVSVSAYVNNCRYSAYLDYCEECEYCFGCVGLRKKKLCVLNKQYGEAEYKELVEKIKKDLQKRGEWGKFWPLKMAHSGYNLSLAHIFFPETKEKILAMGGLWDEEKKEKFEGISGDDLPDKIEDAPDGISEKRIICPKTGLSFNIAPHELEFYKKHGIPLPRYHFDWRTLDRFRPMTLAIFPQTGVCVFCGREVGHYYSPELGYEKIACITCYQKTI